MAALPVVLAALSHSHVPRALSYSVAGQHMTLTLKDAASFCGLTVVATIAIYFCYVPDLLKEGRLTPHESVWIGAGMTVLSLAFFAVEKVLNSRDEKERKREEAAREAQRQKDEGERKI